MGTVLLLTKALQPSADVLPGLALLSHQVKILPAEGSALLEAPDHDLLMVDGRRELAHARDLCRLIRTTGSDQPVLLIVTEGGLAVVAADWGMDDVILETAGPAEIDARIRVAIGKLAARNNDSDPESHIIRSGEVVVDEATYTAKLGGRVLDLTFKEFELLKYLAQHPGRVFTRDQLLQEVWGYDYFGGTRTVDVHVRRLRAKLGTEQRGADRHGAQRRLPVRAAAARPGRFREVRDGRGRPGLLGGRRVRSVAAVHLPLTQQRPRGIASCHGADRPDQLGRLRLGGRGRPGRGGTPHRARRDRARRRHHAQRAGGAAAQAPRPARRRPVGRRRRFRPAARRHPRPRRPPRVAPTGSRDGPRGRGAARRSQGRGLVARRPPGRRCAGREVRHPPRARAEDHEASRCSTTSDRSRLRTASRSAASSPPTRRHCWRSTRARSPTTPSRAT